MSQTIDIQIPAAVGNNPGTLTIQYEYKVFRVEDLTGDFYVQPGLSAVKKHIVAKGDGFGTAQSTSSYVKVILTNTNAVAVNATIYLGSDKFDSGTATVIDLSQALTTQAVLVSALGLPGGNPVALGAATFSKLKLIAQKDLNRTVNVGNVYFGVIDDNAKLYRTMAPGDEITIDAPAGRVMKLSDFWMNADNAGDGLVLEYC